MLIWIVVLLVLVLVYYYVIKPWNYWKQKDIVHERGWPLVGILGDFLLRRKHFVMIVDDLYKRHPNERYVGINILINPNLFVLDLELIKLITVKDFNYFQDHAGLSDNSNEVLLSKMLIALKGQQWRHMRAKLSPAFTSSKMKMMYVLMDQCAKNFVQHYRGKEPVAIQMKEIFSKFANDVIATAAFGIEVDSLHDPDNEFYRMGIKLTKVSPVQIIRRLIVQFLPKLANMIGLKMFDTDVDEFFLTLVKNTMKEREEKGIVRPDMIHLLMLAQKGQLKHETTKEKLTQDGFATVEESHIGKEDVEMKLDDEALAAQAMLFFVAGLDGVSTTSCFLAHELAVHPEIQVKLQKEIDDAKKEHNSNVPYDALLKMKYLDQVISETLRLWPPGFQMERQCIRDYTIQPVEPDAKPFVLKKGESVVMPVYSIHRDPRYFSDPDRFDPERFNDDNKHKIIPGTYMPFGVGPRNCIGSRFALLELKVLFIHLLSKFNIVVTDKTEIPLKLSAKAFMMEPTNGFWLGFSPRKVTDLCELSIVRNYLLNEG